MELNAVAQHEGVSLAILRDLIALRYRGYQFAVFVGLNKALENVVQDFSGSCRYRFVRVKTVQILCYSNYHRSTFHVFFRFLRTAFACAKCSHREYQKENASKCFLHLCSFPTFQWNLCNFTPPYYTARPKNASVFQFPGGDAPASRPPRGCRAAISGRKSPALQIPGGCRAAFLQMICSCFAVAARRSCKITAQRAFFCLRAVMIPVCRLLLPHFRLDYENNYGLKSKFPPLGRNCTCLSIAATCLTPFPIRAITA